MNLTNIKINSILLKIEQSRTEASKFFLGRLFFVPNLGKIR